VLVFVAPTIAGGGPALLGGLPRPAALTRFQARALGDDVLLSAYVHEP
jgi:riboflavin biosynthesis pyrimidine reductase